MIPVFLIFRNVILIQSPIDACLKSYNINYSCWSLPWWALYMHYFLQSSTFFKKKNWLLLNLFLDKQFFLFCPFGKLDLFRKWSILLNFLSFFHKIVCNIILCVYVCSAGSSVPFSFLWLISCTLSFLLLTNLDWSLLVLFYWTLYDCPLFSHFKLRE